MKNKKVVYTAITGDYDNLKTPEYINPDWDYICFTNNPDIKSDVWQIRRINYNNISDKMLARRVKIKYYEFISEYDMSLWLDASIQIKGNITEFVINNTEYFGNSDFVLLKHPIRKNILDEAEACVKLKKDTPDVIQNMMLHFYSKGYGFEDTLPATGLMFRNHTKETEMLCRVWYLLLEMYSHRDQLSFNYAQHKTGLNIGFLPYDTIKNGKYFKLMPHKF